MTYIRKTAIIVLFSFCLGCESEGLSDLKNEVARIKRRPLPVVSEQELLLQAPAFSYAATDKPCPFTRRSAEQEKSQSAPFPAMKQVGSIDKNGDSWALFEDDKGSIHVVSGEKYMNKQQKNG